MKMRLKFHWGFSAFGPFSAAGACAVEVSAAVRGSVAGTCSGGQASPAAAAAAETSEAMVCLVGSEKILH